MIRAPRGEPPGSSSGKQGAPEGREKPTPPGYAPLPRVFHSLAFPRHPHPRLAGHHLPHDEEANPIRAARPSMIVINIAYPVPSLDPREKLHSLFPRPSG